MQLKRGIIFFAILVLVFSMFSVNARIMHLSNDVRVLIDGEGRTLSSAVSGGFLIGQRDSGDPQFISNPGHSSNEIWISIDGSEMTLKEGISSPGGLCGSMNIDSYSSLSIPPLFHLATEIELLSGKTLQQAINDGDFCERFYSWYIGTYGDWNSTNTCAGCRTREVYCRSDDGIQVEDSYCSGTKICSRECRMCEWQVNSITSCNWWSHDGFCTSYSGSCSSLGATRICLYQRTGCVFFTSRKAYIECKGYSWCQFR